MIIDYSRLKSIMIRCLSPESGMFIIIESITASGDGMVVKVAINGYGTIGKRVP